MGFFTKVTKTPIFHYEHLTPEQLAGEKTNLRGAEQGFLDKWGKPQTPMEALNAFNAWGGVGQQPNPYITSNITDPYQRAMTNFALSQEGIPKPALNPDNPQPMMMDSSWLSGLMSQNNTNLFARPELSYTSGTTPPIEKGADNPMDIMQPAKNPLFLGTRLGGGDNRLSGMPLSTGDFYDKLDPSVGDLKYLPKHITDMKTERHFNIKPLAALLSIASAGMGGMLAAPAGAGASAGAGAGSLSASEAAAAAAPAAAGTAAPAVAAPAAGTVAPSLFEGALPTIGGNVPVTMPIGINTMGAVGGAGAAGGGIAGLSGMGGNAQSGMGSVLGDSIPQGINTAIWGENMNPTWWDMLKQIGSQAQDLWDKSTPLRMIAGLGSQVLGANSESNMMKGLNEAQAQSYQDYLGGLNPPQSVLDTRFNQLKNQVISSAPTARRRISDEMASRGIKGRGAASPIAQNERAIQDDINRAYFQTYGNYNVPQMAPPVNYTPSTGQLLGKNLSDIGMMMAMKQLWG